MYPNLALVAGLIIIYSSVAGASVVFAVMVANAGLLGGHTLAVAVAITVILSVLAHGFTANPLVSAYVRRMKEKTA